MNWSKNSSIELSRICVVLFMILLAALDIGCYWAVQWFVEIRLMYWQYGVLMMVTIYLCSGFGWVLLVRLWQLLQNIRARAHAAPADLPQQPHVLRVEDELRADILQQLPQPHEQHPAEAAAEVDRAHHQEYFPAGHRHEGRARPHDLGGAAWKFS